MSFGLPIMRYSHTCPACGSHYAFPSQRSDQPIPEHKGCPAKTGVQPRDDVPAAEDFSYIRSKMRPGA